MAALSTPGLFSGVAAAAGGDDDGEGDGDEEQEPEEPPVAVERKKNEDEDEVFEVERSKVTMWNAEAKEWVGRGKGRLYVLKDKKTGKQRIVMHAESTGKVMFNAPLNASVAGTIKRTKNNVAVAVVSYSPSQANPNELEADNGGKPALYKFTVPDANADALEQAVREACRA